MQLTPEQEAVLAGQSGEALGLAMRTLVDYDTDESLYDLGRNGDSVTVDGSTGEIRIG